MTHFLDGPAKGQHLMLRRSPVFLRVVEQGGKWDALDAPEDTLRPGETANVYRRKGEASCCHIRSGKPGASGFYAIAEYEYVANPPHDGVLRDEAEWRLWVCEQ